MHLKILLSLILIFKAVVLCLMPIPTLASFIFTEDDSEVWAQWKLKIHCDHLQVQLAKARVHLKPPWRDGVWGMSSKSHPCSRLCKVL